MKRQILTTSVLAAAFAVLPTTAAFADSPGYSPPDAVSDSCNAGHGTYGALGGHDNNAGVNDLGSNGAPGAANPHAPNPDDSTTGGSNSGYSQDCRTGG